MPASNSNNNNNNQHDQQQQQQPNNQQQQKQFVNNHHVGKQTGTTTTNEHETECACLCHLALAKSGPPNGSDLVAKAQNCASAQPPDLKQRTTAAAADADLGSRQRPKAKDDDGGAGSMIAAAQQHGQAEAAESKRRGIKLDSGEQKDGDNHQNKAEAEKTPGDATAAAAAATAHHCRRPSQQVREGATERPLPQAPPGLSRGQAGQVAAATATGPANDDDDDDGRDNQILGLVGANIAQTMHRRHGTTSDDCPASGRGDTAEPAARNVISASASSTSASSTSSDLSSSGSASSRGMNMLPNNDNNNRNGGGCEKAMADADYNGQPADGPTTTTTNERNKQSAAPTTIQEDNRSTRRPRRRHRRQSQKSTAADGAREKGASSPTNNGLNNSHHHEDECDERRGQLTTTLVAAAADQPQQQIISGSCTAANKQQQQQQQWQLLTDGKETTDRTTERDKEKGSLGSKRSSEVSAATITTTGSESHTSSLVNYSAYSNDCQLLTSNSKGAPAPLPSIARTASRASATGPQAPERRPLQQNNRAAADVGFVGHGDKVTGCLDSLDDDCCGCCCPELAPSSNNEQHANIAAAAATEPLGQRGRNHSPASPLIGAGGGGGGGEFGRNERHDGDKQPTPAAKQVVVIVKQQQQQQRGNATSVGSGTSGGSYNEPPMGPPRGEPSSRSVKVDLPPPPTCDPDPSDRNKVTRGWLDRLLLTTNQLSSSLFGRALDWLAGKKRELANNDASMKGVLLVVNEKGQSKLVGCANCTCAYAYDTRKQTNSDQQHHHQLTTPAKTTTQLNHHSVQSVAELDGSKQQSAAIMTTTMTAVKLSPHFQQQQQLKELAAEGLESKRERKAAKTLAIITGVFVMCWLPFFVMAITMPLLNLKPHKYVFALLLWLGYFNSMLNPIIYTIFSPDFRKAFKRLLCAMDGGGQETPARRAHRLNQQIQQRQRAAMATSGGSVDGGCWDALRDRATFWRAGATTAAAADKV